MEKRYDQTFGVNNAKVDEVKTKTSTKREKEFASSHRYIQHQVNTSAILALFLRYTNTTTLMVFTTICK